MKYLVAQAQAGRGAELVEITQQWRDGLERDGRIDADFQFIFPSRADLPDPLGQ